MSLRFLNTLSRAAPAVRLRCHLSTESERLHGKLRSSDVSSKAMRRALRAAEPLPPVAAPPPPSHLAAPPPPGQGAPPSSFGATFLVQVLQGAGIACGFMLIFGALRAVGLEGEEGAQAR